MAGGGCGRTRDIGRFGNRPSLPVDATCGEKNDEENLGNRGQRGEYVLKSTLLGAPGVVLLAPVIVGEMARAGGVTEGTPELGGGDTGEAYDGGEGVSDGGDWVVWLSACGGIAGPCVVVDSTAAADGVVLSLS